MVTGDPVVDTGTAVSIVDDPAAVVGEAEAGGNIVCMDIIITMLTSAVTRRQHHGDAAQRRAGDGGQ